MVGFEVTEVLGLTFYAAVPRMRADPLSCRPNNLTNSLTFPFFFVQVFYSNSYKTQYQHSLPGFGAALVLEAVGLSVSRADIALQGLLLRDL